MTVKVVHGANDERFDTLEGETVRALRAALTHAFNIPADAVAEVNGVRVTAEYRLRRGDVLEFHGKNAFKGLGELLTPAELKARWGVTEDQYRELSELGLPTVSFRDGTARHPEAAVDAWFATQLASQGVSGRPTTRKPPGSTPRLRGGRRRTSSVPWRAPNVG